MGDQIQQDTYDIQSLIMLSKKIERQRQVAEDESPILLQKIQTLKNGILKNRFAVLFKSRLLLFKTQGYYEVGSLAMSVYPLIRCTISQLNEKVILTYQINNSSPLSLIRDQKVSVISEELNFEGLNSQKILIFPDYNTAQIWHDETKSLINEVDAKINRHMKLTINLKQNEQSFFGILQKFLWGLCCDIYPKNLNTRYSIYQVTLENLNESTLPYYSIDTQPSQLSSENFVLSQEQQNDLSIQIEESRSSSLNPHSQNDMIKEEDNEKSYENDVSIDNNLFKDENNPHQMEDSTYDQEQVAQYSCLIDACTEQKLSMLEDVQKISGQEYSNSRYEQEYSHTLKDYYQKLSSKELQLKTSAPERVFEIITYFIEEQQQINTDQSIIKEIVKNVLDNFEESLMNNASEVLAELKKFQIPQNQKSFAKLLIKNNILINDIRDFYEIYDEWMHKYPQLMTSDITESKFNSESAADMIFERQNNRKELEQLLIKLQMIDNLRFETVLYKQNIQILKILKQI
ncbi:UNKNOWN [Stylonychia lemnae]|uniref:PH domain-containing protein n=1 Tax=Stylonychia lemnae TaxID=5949 RepID=A0A078B8Q8_STYLE|nr:UNKNOWN [Stylonychia lemnae]|eukprot:CDW90606.1 UNKNOWN [Stylonychia lemnae]